MSEEIKDELLTNIPNPFPDFENNKDEEEVKLVEGVNSPYTGSVIPSKPKNEEIITNPGEHVLNENRTFPSTEPDKGYISPNSGDALISELLSTFR